MKEIDIADELFNELGSPTTLSLPAITYWLRSNIGSLSNYLNEDFSLNNTSLEIEKAVNDEKVQIAKRHILPKQIEENGLTNEEVSFDINSIAFPPLFTATSWLAVNDPGVSVKSVKAGLEAVAETVIVSPLVVKFIPDPAFKVSVSSAESATTSG